MRQYKVAFPFSNGDYYVEIREGKKFVDWLKVGDLPFPMRALVLNPLETHESVRCETYKKARLLVSDLKVLRG